MKYKDMLIVTLVSFVFQKSTENKHWGHKIETEKYRPYYRYHRYSKQKYRYLIDLKNWYRPLTNWGESSRVGVYRLLTVSWRVKFREFITDGQRLFTWLSTL